MEILLLSGHLCEYIFEIPVYYKYTVYKTMPYTAPMRADANNRGGISAYLSSLYKGNYLCPRFVFNIKYSSSNALL